MLPTFTGVWSATSTPTEKAFPAPLSTSVDKSLRDSISANALASSSIIAPSITFSGGLHNQMRAAGGRTSILIFAVVTVSLILISQASLLLGPEPVLVV